MVGKRSLMIAGWAALVIGGLGGCGSGGGDGEEAKVISEALVADGASGCTIQAEVDGGSEVFVADGGNGQTCLASVRFELFDAAGNEFNFHLLSNFFLIPPERRSSFRLRICRGIIGPSDPVLFFIQDTESCPTITRLPGDFALQRPAQEVSCQEIARLETKVTSCKE